MKSPNNTKATAIMAVYNSEQTVAQAINSLLVQSEQVELIVIDDGSSDKTQQIINQINNKNKDKQITILKQNHAGPAIARNFGASHAKSDILLFVDADMHFDKDYVASVIKPIVEGRAIGTFTKEERVDNWDNIYARYWNKEQGWAAKKRFPDHVPDLGTDFRAIKKSEFDRVGGFDNTGYTDTWTLFQKLNFRPLVTTAICYHKNPDDLASVYRQAKWSAKRPYKYGFIGAIYALLRTSFPVSIFLGLIYSFQIRDIRYLVFKTVYDVARFLGIIEMVLFKNLIK